MSYNTRRTGVGRGQTTQVNYHQQPTRPGGNVPRSPTQGYTTTQNANFNSPSQPVYSTQQPGYTSVPPQQTQAQTPVTQPAAQTPATQTPATQTPATQVSSQSPQPPPTPTSTVKDEPATPVSTPKAMETETPENGEEAKNKPFWKKRPYVKLPNKVKRLRQNAKLRRVLNPKNALTFLNELRPGGVKFTQEKVGWGFTASVDIGGNVFTGHALTVSKAKLQSAEQALKHILLEKMSKSQLTPAVSDKEEGDNKVETATSEAMETEEKEAGEEEEEPKAKGRKVEKAEDEMPWGSLAAFALHKLLEEWQKEGEMPVPPIQPQVQYDEDFKEEQFYRRQRTAEYGFFPPRPPLMFGRGRGMNPYPMRGPGFNGPKRFPGPAAGFPSRPAISLGNAVPNSNVMPMKKIPEDANKRNPVMLLNQLKPQIVYNETRESDTNLFKITATLEGQEYVGRGKNKKEAKKKAAISALAPLGINYEGEESSQ